MRKGATFTVAGRGAFPLDMLRYDCCWPMTGDDVTNLDGTIERREITLVSATPNSPTRGRWSSFGWPVIASQQRY